MKNKKLIVMGIIFATIMCVAVGCGCGNSEAVETVATVETTETEETVKSAEESVETEETEKEEETVKTTEGTSTTEETEKEMETSATEDTIETAETDYAKEAEELWGLHSEEFECNYETFRENYTEEREGGSDKETAYETVYNILKKVEENVIVKDYEILSLDPTTMYALQASNIRKGPSTDYEKVGSLVYGEEVTVIGKVTNTEGKEWYVLKGETEEGEEDRMVSSTLLSMEKPQSQAVNSSNNNTSTNTSAPSNNESYIDANTVDWGALGLPAQPDSNIEWGAGIGDGTGAGYGTFE